MAKINLYRTQQATSMSWDVARRPPDLMKRAPQRHSRHRGDCRRACDVLDLPCVMLHPDWVAKTAGKEKHGRRYARFSRLSRQRALASDLPGQ